MTKTYCKNPDGKLCEIYRNGTKIEICFKGLNGAFLTIYSEDSLPQWVKDSENDKTQKEGEEDNIRLANNVELERLMMEAQEG